MRTRCVDCLYCVDLEDKRGDERYICVNNDSERFLKEVEPEDDCGSAVDDTDLDGECDDAE